MNYFNFNNLFITYMKRIKRAALYLLNKTESVFIKKSIVRKQNCKAKIEQYRPTLNFIISFFKLNSNNVHFTN